MSFSFRYLPTTHQTCVQLWHCSLVFTWWVFRCVIVVRRGPGDTDWSRKHWKSEDGWCLTREYRVLVYKRSNDYPVLHGLGHHNVDWPRACFDPIKDGLFQPPQAAAFNENILMNPVFATYPASNRQSNVEQNTAGHISCSRWSTPDSGLWLLTSNTSQ